MEGTPLMEPESRKPPTVSVIIVNYRGADDTIECLNGIEQLDWPTDQLEVIVVDNASGDDSLDKIRSAAAPSVKVIAADANTGFAGGCNRGVDEANNDYVAFINNDARPDPQWLATAVPVLEGHGSVGCVASKVLDWEGKAIDFGGAGFTFYGHGFKLHTGLLDNDHPDQEADVLFPSGAAMLMEREVFQEIGGFDTRYFMLFEDVDIGVRLWVLGYRVRYVPESIVYHKFHASMRGIKSWREHYLLERNALFTMFKNYDDQNLAALLGPAVVLAALRGVVLGGDDPDFLDLARSHDLEERDVVEVHGHTAAAALALASFAEALPDLLPARREIQSRRTRSDREVFALFRRPLRPNIEDPRFVGPFNTALDAFGVNKLFGKRSRIVVATGDTLSPTMAGPAIRAWEIARALAPEHEVKLVSTTEASGLTDPDLEISKVGAPELAILESWCDILIFQGYLMEEYPFLKYSNKVMVVDVYDPFHLEQLEQARDLTRKHRRQVVLGATRVLNDQLARGDLFMCASEKQRDFWLGQLSGMGRINPLTYDAGETLRGLVTVVPFGVADAPPRHTRPVLKGVVPGIGPNDKVILWGGGVYNWLDPITLIRAIDKLRSRVDDVRLFFLGLRHPNPNVPEMRMAAETRRLAEDLGLVGTHVFFNEGWVEYAQRQDYLLESDVGVSTHLEHIETEFSFRTRILDYLWASLPVVATSGDSLAELIETRDLGLTVTAGDVDGLEAALHRVLTDDAFNARCRENAIAVASEMRWSNVLAPLVEFCQEPHRAADLLDPKMAELLGVTANTRRAALRRVLRRDASVAITYVRRGDFRTFVRAIRRRLDRLSRI
jgi:GT2 family glycosyltransferase/glycosyltransferase involved in cell wall biosynthesis